MACEASSGDDCFLSSSRHNIWLNSSKPRQIDDSDEKFRMHNPLHDLQSRQLKTVVGSVACDRLRPPTEGGLLLSLYESAEMLSFVARCTSSSTLHRLADPLGACSINVFGEGMSHAYHFDESEYTTTIMLQTAEEGGRFEVLPKIRDALDDGQEEAIAATTRALDDRSHTGKFLLSISMSGRFLSSTGRGVCIAYRP
eukprot:g3168.t1